MFDAAAFKREAYEELGVPVLTDGGGEFYALFKVADANAFDAAQVGDYVLRYPAGSAPLQTGDRLTIAGQAYRVAEHPRRMGDGGEYVVALMEDRP